MWADYKLPDVLRIEVAYMTDKRAVVLEQDGATWTIDVNTMTRSMTQQVLSGRFGKSSWSWTELRECLLGAYRQ